MMHFLVLITWVPCKYGDLLIIHVKCQNRNGKQIRTLSLCSRDLTPCVLWMTRPEISGIVSIIKVRALWRPHMGWRTKQKGPKRDITVACACMTKIYISDKNIRKREIQVMMCGECKKEISLDFQTSCNFAKKREVKDLFLSRYYLNVCMLTMKIALERQISQLFYSPPKNERSNQLMTINCIQNKS